eukprot:s4058_g3.t1
MHYAAMARPQELAKGPASPPLTATSRKMAQRFTRKMQDGLGGAGAGGRGRQEPPDFGTSTGGGAGSFCAIEVEGLKRRPPTKELVGSQFAEAKAPTGSKAHVEMMYWRHHQAEMRRQGLRELRQEQEVAECTFRPRLVARRAKSAEGLRRDQI